MEDAEMSVGNIMGCEVTHPLERIEAEWPCVCQDEMWRDGIFCKDEMQSNRVIFEDYVKEVEQERLQLEWEGSQIV